MAFLNAYRRKVLASATLGCWLFVLFVGVVHACGLDEKLSHLQSSIATSSANPGQGDDHPAPGCEQFCADNVPVLAKLQSANDQPYVQSLLLPAFLSRSALLRAAIAPSVLHRQHQPPRIALNTLFVRLAL